MASVYNVGMKISGCVIAVAFIVACTPGAKGDPGAAGSSGAAGPTGPGGPPGVKGDPGDVVAIFASDGGRLGVDGGVIVLPSFTNADVIAAVAPQVVWKDAVGAIVPRVMRFGNLSTLFYFDQHGLLWRVDVEKATLSPLGESYAHYTTVDCSGTPAIYGSTLPPPPRMTFVVGDKTFVRDDSSLVGTSAANLCARKNPYTAVCQVLSAGCTYGPVTGALTAHEVDGGVPAFSFVAPLHPELLR